MHTAQRYGQTMSTVQQEEHVLSTHTNAFYQRVLASRFRELLGERVYKTITRSSRVAAEQRGHSHCQATAMRGRGPSVGALILKRNSYSMWNLPTNNFGT